MTVKHREASLTPVRILTLTFDYDCASIRFRHQQPVNVHGSKKNPSQSIKSNPKMSRHPRSLINTFFICSLETWHLRVLILWLPTRWATAMTADEGWVGR